MKHGIFATFILLLLTGSLFAQEYTVTGGNGEPYLGYSENRMAVYLLNGMQNARISYTAEGVHQWYKYKERASEAVAIPCTQEGNMSYIENVEEGYGYFVGSYLRVTADYVWIIDYSRYLPNFFSMRTDEDESDRCEYLKIIFEIDENDLQYFLPTGYSQKIARKYQLTYDNLVWDNDLRQFNQEKQTKNLTSPLSEEVIDAPLMNTKFTLKGDQIAQHFGINLEMETPVYNSIAVKAYAFSEKNKEKADNEMSEYSAPVEYTFTAYANDPVERYTWKVIEYDSITGEARTKFDYRDKVLKYQFEEVGTYDVILEVDGPNFTCMDSVKILELMRLEDTEIKIPNAFSPGSSIGVNDEFKIGYKSILSFKAFIYNRWGNLLFQWTDPNKGWDGRVNGKFVPTGVYFVVVEYTNTKGKKKHVSSDINILRMKN